MPLNYADTSKMKSIRNDSWNNPLFNVTRDY